MRLSRGRIRRFFLGLSPEEATFARRGFRAGDASDRLRLEQIGRIFIAGYHSALDEDNPDKLGPQLNEVDAEFRGFAFEGAAMGLFLLDHLAPWRRDRLLLFLAGTGAPNIYMVYVGAGWALAQLRRRVGHALAQLDPLLGWLAVDGYGFHHGYFRWPDSVERQRVPRRLSGYARRAFDQGLGRSLWFVEGAEGDRISATIGRFPQARHADLWSGVGLACAYAGGVDRAAIEGLVSLAGAHHPWFAQGAAFAAKARQRASNPATHTDLACQVVCGMPAENAALLTDRALQDLPADGLLPAYEVWRQRIQANWFPGAHEISGSTSVPPIRLSATLSPSGAREFFVEHL